MGDRKEPTPVPMDQVKPTPPPAPPSPDSEIRYLGDLQRLELKPGDRLVLTLAERHVPIERLNYIRQQLEKYCGGVQVLILTDGAKLGAVNVDEIK